MNKLTKTLHENFYNKDLQTFIDEKGFIGIFISKLNNCYLNIKSDGCFRNTICLFSIYDYPQHEGLTIVPNNRLELGDVIAMCTGKVYDNTDFPNLSFTNQSNVPFMNGLTFNKEKPKIIDKDNLDINANDFTFWKCRELENAEIIDLSKYGFENYFMIGLKTLKE